MGLFCLSFNDTPEDKLNAALGNLEIFRELLEGYDGIRDKYGNRMPDYLIGMVENQIKDALKYLSETNPTK